MAVDKLVDSTQLDADLTSVANAIRTKGGTSSQLRFPDEFVSAIGAISGGGGSNTPVAEATITSVSASGNNRSFDVTLPRAITKGIVLFEPDNNTKTDIFAGTSTSYYIVSMFAMFPTSVETAGSASLCTRVSCVNYRGSSGTFNTRASSSTANFNITISGTTMSVMWGTSSMGNFFPGGTYKVTVWEVADS